MSENVEESPTPAASSNAQSNLRFESKFSKNFQHQIRGYVDAIFKQYTKKFKKPLELNQIEKDFFWLVIAYFINRKAGVCMNVNDIKSQYFRKHSRQRNRRIVRTYHDKRLIKKIMK